MTVRPLRWVGPPEGPAIELLDQNRLPAEEKTIVCRDVPSLVAAIRQLAIRGAPLLGIAGAYGVALAAWRGDDVAAAAAELASARPTAVNLGWGVRRALHAYIRAAQVADHEVVRSAMRASLAEAERVAAEDAAACAAMAAHGLTLVPERARILTHCNTGALVTGGEGTAFAVIAAAHRAGRLAWLWVDETRPLLQGSRLTAWEARQAGIPHAVLADSAAASLLATGRVDLVLTGADRIAADGCVANKVGTYALAVLASHHRVPFVVVAPTSTIDAATATGSSIVIEERPAAEVTGFGGQPVAPAGTGAYNPAFDVTPPSLVTALVTERGVTRPVTAGNLQALVAGPSAN
jgi:methylthioribose-1-phosphate isomerase